MNPMFNSMMAAGGTSPQQAGVIGGQQQMQGAFGGGPVRQMGMGGTPMPSPGAVAGRFGGAAGPGPQRGGMSSFYRPNLMRAGVGRAGIGLGVPQGGLVPAIQQNYQQTHGGVAMHNPGGYGPNAVQQARMQGPDQAAIMAEMQRRQVGANIGNASPQNAAIAGYMMGQ